jgi:hypothetical protein
VVNIYIVAVWNMTFRHLVNIHQGLEENIASIYRVVKQTTLSMDAVGFTAVSDGSNTLLSN